MDTIHLKYPLILFGSEGSALFFLFFFFHIELICFVIFSSTITMDHFLEKKDMALNGLAHPHSYSQKVAAHTGGLIYRLPTTSLLIAFFADAQDLSVVGR